MSNDGAQSGKYQHGPPMGEMNMPGMGMPGFNDPQAMAMMWQRMMMSELGVLSRGGGGEMLMTRGIRYDEPDDEHEHDEPAE